MSETEIREVDRRNGNGSRARRQAERAESGLAPVVEDEAGNVHRTTSTTLVIPEAKRCTAMTVRGTRCKVGRMRGLEVCVFHSHLALTDEGLASLADPSQKPRLSPRAALQAVVALRAEELAEAAVRGALDADGFAATRATLALVDAVDPLVEQGASITLTKDGMAEASFAQLRQVFSATLPPG